MLMHVNVQRNNRCLHILCWHSLVTIPWKVNIQPRESKVHSRMNARTISSYAVPFSPESNSALHSHLGRGDENKRYPCPHICGPTWIKSQVEVKYPQRFWEHNILIYRISNAESNIILLHWNKQHLECGIIEGGRRLLNENFHLVLMLTHFGSMQGYTKLERWAV